MEWYQIWKTTSKYERKIILLNAILSKCVRSIISQFNTEDDEMEMDKAFRAGLLEKVVLKVNLEGQDSNQLFK